MKIFKTVLYWLASFTWGIVMTLFGCICALGLLITGHKPQKFHYSIYFEVGQNWGGFEAGPFFFCNKNSSLHIKQHEHGHGIQNIIFGPLMPFLVSIPSCARYWYREVQDKHWNKLYKNKKLTYEEWRAKYSNRPGYDAIWFEGWATKLGEKYFK